MVDGGPGGFGVCLPGAGKWLHLEILLDPEELREGHKEFARRFLIIFFLLYSYR